MKNVSPFLRTVLALALTFSAGCSGASSQSASADTGSSGAPTYAEMGCANDAFERLRSTESSGAEVTICGHVASVRGDVRTRGGLHKHWRLDAGDRHAPIEIDSNEDLEGIFAVAPGDYAIVRGEYYHDPDGREGVHYTHRDPRGRHDAGFVSLAGKVYQ